MEQVMLGTGQGSSLKIHLCSGSASIFCEAYAELGETMKIYWLIILSLLLLGANGCNLPNSYDATPGAEFGKYSLSLTLELNKNAYAKNEAIEAIVTLTNDGEHDLMINSRMAVNHAAAPALVRDVEFIIFSSSGEKAELKVKVNVRPIRNNDFVILYPGHSTQAQYDLEEFYFLNEVGTYSVIAVYENGFDPDNGHSAWKGRIESNKIEFTIE